MLSVRYITQIRKMTRYTLIFSCLILCMHFCFYANSQELPASSNNIQSINNKTVASKVNIESEELNAPISSLDILKKVKKTITPVIINEAEEEVVISRGAEKANILVDSNFPSAQKKSFLNINIKDGREGGELIDIVSNAYNAAKIGQFESSIYLYKKALAIEPNNSNTLFALGSLYQKLKQYNDAKEYYKKVLTIDPEYKKALHNYILMMSEDINEESISSLLELEQANPEYSPVLAQIGMVYAKLNMLDKAETYLKKAITYSPEISSYRYNLAVVYDRLGRVPEAKMMYKQLLEMDINGVASVSNKEQIQNRLYYLETKNAVQSN
jgi:tetratricopeptide (TPR) repeat protein